MNAAPDYPPISVIMSVLNEARHLESAVHHILGQDYPGPLEVVIALGPSHDETDQVATRLAAAEPRVTLVPNPSGITPTGLNAALAATRYEIVARVDGHAVIPADYLRIAVDTLRSTGADNVGGIMWAEGTTAFERAVARAMTSPLGVGNARFHTGGQAGPADTVYLGVFRRAALERLGGYDESFLRAQDWELNYRLRAAGGVVWFQPAMRVSYRPRPNLRALAKQYFNYGRWRREVMRQHQGSATLRYLAPPMALAAIVAGSLVGVTGLVLGVPILLLGFAVPAGYLAAVLAGAVVTGRGLSRPALAALPAVYACMHLSWGAGFLTSPRRLRRAADPAGAQPAPASGQAG
ncbi:MAG: glycosyltransferase family 2 protein [Sporichthyaceae bacterium]|nr:glycosyltransferase family 2 protein [Sporichthyaceae bacterium]